MCQICKRIGEESRGTQVRDRAAAPTHSSREGTGGRAGNAPNQPPFEVKSLQISQAVKETTVTRKLRMLRATSFADGNK